MVKGSLNFFAALLGLLAVFLAAIVGGFFAAIFGLNFWIGFVIVAILGLWLLIAYWVAMNRAGEAAGQVAAAITELPTGGSRADELQKLARLRDSGALTEEEFAAAKAQLLRES